MASSHLNITPVTSGQNNKEITINDADSALELATQKVLAVDMAAGNVTLTASQFTRNATFLCSGLTTARTLNVPQDVGAGAGTAHRTFTVINNSDYTLTVKGATTGTGVALEKSRSALLVSNGAEVYAGTSGLGNTGIRIGAFVPGDIIDAALLLRYEVVSGFTLPAGLTESKGHLVSTPEGGNLSLSIAKNGTNIGSIDFTDGANVATFSLASSNTFFPGDYLTITAPADVYGAADLSFTLLGE